MPVDRLPNAVAAACRPDPLATSVRESLRYAVAASVDGSRVLSVFDSHGSAAVELSPAMAVHLADLLVDPWRK